MEGNLDLTIVEENLLQLTEIMTSQYEFFAYSMGFIIGVLIMGFVMGVWFKNV